MKRLLFLLVSLSSGLHAQTTMFTSDFNGNTGAVVLAGNTDNTSGSTSLGVTWNQHASVSAISGLTAISTGDSGSFGGFAQLQNGTAAYANANNVYLSRNHNLDTNRASSKRGFSFTFTLGASWDLGALTVLSGHTSNTGNLDQDLTSKLNISLSGGTLGSPISASSVEDYQGAPPYRTVPFSLTGNTLGAGTYTVEVWQSDLVGGGAYAIYDGITLAGAAAAVASTTSVIDFGLAGTTAMVGTINQFAENNITAQTATNLVLNSTTGTDSGIRLSTSGGIFSAGSGGSFSPAGTTGYTGGSTVIDGWIANEKVAYGDIWQGTAHGTPQTVNLTFSSLAANTNYTFKLLSGRANVYNTGNGTYNMTYNGGGNLAGGGTHSSAGSAAGLGATNYTWSFATGATPGNAVLNLAGTWNINALIITQTTNPGAPAIASFTTDDGYLSPGQSATLSWQVTGADSLAISPDVGTVTGTSVVVSPTQTTTYTLTATNAVGSSTATVKVAAGPARPNILFFLVDDMGANDTSVPFLTDAAGNDVPTTANGVYWTPYMATLASQGMKFTRTYAMPVCSPTRVSLMTGMNSARHYVTDWTDTTNVDTSQNSDPTHRSPRYWRTQGLDVTPNLLPKLLGNAGYRSIAVGKAHFGNQAGYNINPHDFGFDVSIGGKETGRPGSYLNANNFGSGTYQVPDLQAYWKSNYGQDIFLTEALTLEMNKEIEKSVNAGVPFFAYMSHYAVHDPYDSDSRFINNPRYAGISGNYKSFATLIEGMDKSLGDITTKLNALGVAENTLIIFLSDNGSTLARGDDPRRGYKGQKYEGGTRVPMIVGWAAPNAANPFQTTLNIPAASRVNDIVSINDLFPTILATAGIPAPAIPLDGTDISPYLRGTPGFHRPQELMIHFPHDHNGADGDYYSVLHDGDYKLIYSYTPDTYELYNLPIDAHENNNLAAAQPARVMAMARKMARQLRDQTGQWSRFSSNLADDPILMPLLPGVDLDGDGISDNAEDPNRNGLVDPGETDPDNADSDGDGTRDGAEVKTGTDPLNPMSSFRATLSTDPETAALQLSWPSKPGASYRVESSETLANDWQILAANVPAASSGSVTTYPLPPLAGEPRMFYRALLK